MKIKIFYIFLLIFIASSFVVSQPTLAQTKEGASSNWLQQIGIPDGQIIPAACTKSYTRTELNKTSIVDKCGLNEIFQMMVNFATIVVGLTGSAALLMIVYGGAMFILAAGQADRITKAKTILKAASVGLVIILLAWIIINTIILALTGGEIGNPATLFGQAFNKPQNVQISQ